MRRSAARAAMCALALTAGALLARCAAPSREPACLAPLSDDARAPTQRAHLQNEAAFAAALAARQLSPFAVPSTTIDTGVGSESAGSERPALPGHSGAPRHEDGAVDVYVDGTTTTLLSWGSGGLPAELLFARDPEGRVHRVVSAPRRRVVAALRLCGCEPSSCPSSGIAPSWVAREHRLDAPYAGPVAVPWDQDFVQEQRAAGPCRSSCGPAPP